METINAWAAGFFDGEGCVQVLVRENRRRGVRYQLSCEVSQTDRRPLDLLVLHFGGTVRYRSMDKSRILKPHYKPQWVWKIRNVTAQRFLRAIYPYLTVKQEHAALVLNFSADTWGLPGLKKAIKLELMALKKVRGEVVPATSNRIVEALNQPQFELD